MEYGEHEHHVGMICYSLISCTLQHKKGYFLKLIDFSLSYRTLTAPVKLRDCLQAIKEHAFEASKYPVVITFEDHLTRHPRLQAKVAKVSRTNLFKWI